MGLVRLIAPSPRSIYSYNIQRNYRDYEDGDMNPMLDPKRDLAGATPVTLARALLRPLRPSARVEPVVGDKAPVQKIPANQSSDGVPHLRKRS